MVSKVTLAWSACRGSPEAVRLQHRRLINLLGINPMHEYMHTCDHITLNGVCTLSTCQG